ncbi:MAG: hypothetical protein KKH61_21095 [Gammaproteobacteria bacterium]|nr:hypothetical protein [Gammaproteobacteria bacterium]
MDILDVEITFPETVYVVATGKESPEVYALIPDDAFVIVVNGAIEIPLPVIPAIWIIADPLAAETDYCKAGMAEIEEARYSLNPHKIKANKKTIPLVEVGKILPRYPFVRATFKLVSGASGAFTKESCFRNNATTSGIAVQLCYLKGVKRVFIIGVNLDGSEYWDQQKESDPDFRDDSAWKFHSDYWKWMIHVLTNDRKFSVEPLRNIQIKPTFAGIYRDKKKKLINREILKVEKRLPTIGYLCMAYDPVDTRHAIHDFYYQDYPPELRTLYLMYQRDSANEFPVQIETNLDNLNMVQVKVDGMWPELWLFKLMAYLENSREDYTLWWDEDDCYPEGYTADCIEPILRGESEIAWNYDCLIIDRFNFRKDKYNSPIGTMIIKTDILREVAQMVWQQTYEGSWTSPKRLPRINYNGAKDNQLRLLIENQIGGVANHKGMRSYIFHSQVNTIGGREPDQNADYQSGRARKKKWQKEFWDAEQRKKNV